ncbi:MAG: hypothetical protein V1869_03680 [Candidatus Omnitrophota bacterium]
MKKFIYLFAMAVLLGGCASTAKYDARLNTWIGASENDLVASWGVPNKTYKLDNGKKAVEYVHKNTVQGGGYMYTVPQTTYQSGRIGDKSYSGTSITNVTEIAPIQKYKLSCKTSFIINNNGKVESWHHEGNDCIAN